MTCMDRRRSVAALSKDRLYKVGDAVPTIVADFKRRKYLLSGEFVSFDDMFTHTRSSSATYNDANGNFVTMGSNVPRVGHHVWDGNRYVNRGLLMEGQRVNGITNNTMQGAVAGVLGSGGALPSNGWSIGGGIAPSDVEVVGTGVDEGVEYIDIRFNGTPTGNFYSFLNGITQFGLAQTDDCSFSSWIKIVGGDDTNFNAIRLNTNGYDAGGKYVSFSGTPIAPDSSWTRYQHNGTPQGATVAHGVPLIQFNWNSGPIDLTLRIGLPQIEKSSVATSPIKTSGAAATRAPDLLTMTNLSGLSDGFWVVLPAFTLNGVDGAYDRVIQFDDGDSGNRSAIYYNDVTNNLGVGLYVSGVQQAEVGRLHTLGDTTKIAVRFGPNKFAVVWDGGTIYEDTNCQYVTPDRLYLAASGASASAKPASMSLAGIMLHPPTITPAQMAAHLGGLS